MSATYPNLPETNFPESYDIIARMSDITYADIQLIDAYTGYINAGNVLAAQQLLNDNPGLQTKIFNAQKFNILADAIMAVQRFFKEDVESYITSKAGDIEAEINEFTDKGAYSSGAAYKKFNIVTYNGEAYICIKDSKGNSPTNPTYWSKIAARGQQGVSGTGLAFKGTYSSTTDYSKDDCVTDGSKIWAALQASKGQPLVEGAYWTVAISISTSVSDVVETHNTSSAAHSALFANKSDTGHTHSQYLTAHQDISGKLDKSGGTMTGQLVAYANTAYTTYQVRNIALSTTAAVPTGNGSLLGVYS